MPLTESQQIRLSPVLVRRRCRVPAEVLRGLGSDEVWHTAEDLADAGERCRLVGRALADRIAPLIPEAAQEQRRLLLHARREAFNARPLTTAPPLDGVAEYQRAVADRERCAEALRRHAGELDDSTRGTLRAALDDPGFAASVEMSVPGLVAAVRADGPGSLSARSRRRALTLLRLVQRAAAKPSPFARFTDSTLLLPGAAERPPHGHVRVDRRALDWVRDWVRTSGLTVVPGDRVLLTTNPSATVADGRVSWLAGEGLRSARCTEQLGALLAGLRTPTPLAELCAGGAVPQALRELVRNGLLEAGPCLPGWGRETLTAAAAAVGTEDPDARAVHDALRALHALESRAASEPPSPSNARERSGRARAAMHRLAVACGHSDEDAARVSGDRLPVTEDLVGVAPAGAPLPSARMLEDLGRIQRIAPLLGPELPFQLAAAVCFRARFGDSEVPLLTAFRWFVESGRQAADELIAESAEPVLADVLRLRGELAGGLAKLAAEASGSGSGTVACDSGWLSALADALPTEVAPWTNVAWPVQWAGGQLVLNGASVGFGRFPARVAGTLTEPELALLRAEIAATVPPGTVPADIAARFGATTNEHPLLLPAALAYPGSALECPSGARIDLSTVTVRAEGGRLIAAGTAFPGRTLLPVPHNATLPSIAPPLYRWLSRLGPSQGSTLALWDLVDAAAGAGGVRRYPRLTVGDLVLCRRTWKVPGEELPAESDVLSWVRWAARTGVPRRSFLRETTLPDPWDVVRGLASGDRVHRARSRAGAAVRKPAYLDLSQPLGRPQRSTAAGETLTFTEPLPDPLATPDEHVAEYVIETYRPSPLRRAS